MMALANFISGLGRGKMTPELERALQQETEILITTYDSEGRPGTVPIWFLYADDKVYLATGRESFKARKLRNNPRVRLRFAGQTGFIEGTGRYRAEAPVIKRIAPQLNARYDGAWGDDTQMSQRLQGGDIVLLEISF